MEQFGVINSKLTNVDINDFKWKPRKYENISKMKAFIELSNLVIESRLKRAERLNYYMQSRFNSFTCAINKIGLLKDGEKT